MEAKGQRIDRYDLVAEIASGGMATVYLARLAGVGGFQRFVAIKRLHPHLAQEAEFVEMFLDEARLAAGIKHANVVPILEVGASEQGYYLVMEYVEGDTLARFLARASGNSERIELAVGLRVMLDAILGLHAAHEHRDEHDQPIELVHRDVSPQNILVGADGVTRLTDFGVARASSRLSATRVGQLKGKIAYMSPEQASGEGDVDRRADVFSAGVVLWEVLAGRRLFKAENEAATLSRVISEPIPNLAKLVPELPEAIVAVCARALERDPAARFPTCAEFAEALEEAAQEADELITAKQVAAYVAEVMGGAISQKREAVRAWLTRSEPGQPAHLGPPSSRRGPPTLPASQSSPSISAPSSISTPSSASAPSLSSTAVSAGQLPPVEEEKRSSKAGLWLALLVLFGAGGAAGWWFTLGPGAESGPGTAAPALDGSQGDVPARAPKRVRQRLVVVPAKAIEPVPAGASIGDEKSADPNAEAEEPAVAGESHDAKDAAEAVPTAETAKPEPQKRPTPKPRSAKKRRASKPAVTRPTTSGKASQPPAERKPAPKANKPYPLDLSNPYR